jgi:citrate synthase
MIVLDGEEYLTVEEAAGLLEIKPATLYAYVSRGVLKSYRQGIKRQRLYRRADVEALLRVAPSSALPRRGRSPRAGSPRSRSPSRGSASDRPRRTPPRPARVLEACGRLRRRWPIASRPARCSPRNGRS